MTNKDLKTPAAQMAMPTCEESRRNVGRLCRIVNLVNGALLDLTVGNSENYIVASPASVAVIKMWRLVPMGPGYALHAVDDISLLRYLAPNSHSNTLTLSTFPITWDLIKTEDYAGDGQMPPDVIEEWMCAICSPFHGRGCKVLDLEGFGTGTKVHVLPFREPRHERCQFWRIQFLDEVPAYAPRLPSLEPIAGPVEDSTSAILNDTKVNLVNGARYIIRNVSSKTVIDWGNSMVPDLVRAYACRGTPNQTWEAVLGNRGWGFKCEVNDQYLTVGQEPASGTYILCRSNMAIWEVQRGEFERENGEDVYRLVLKNTDYSITLNDFGDPRDGSAIVLEKSWDAPHQNWHFEKVQSERV